MLIAIEGIDGAGKHTLTQHLHHVYTQRGKTVSIVSFPRYHHSITAKLAQEALQGHHGDLASSPYAMAILFALDRAEAQPLLHHLLTTVDLVILDRYVASNIAYSAARLYQDSHGPIAQWIYELEYQRFKLPLPDLHLLLDLDTPLAIQRAYQRSLTNPQRRQDYYEHDYELQARTSEIYHQLAQQHFTSPWQLVDPHHFSTQMIDHYMN